MRYSPRPVEDYCTGKEGPGAPFLHLPAHWNLAWLTLPDIESAKPSQWEAHLMERDILTHTWADLYVALAHQYPLAAVDVLLKKPGHRLFIHWDEDTEANTIVRAKEAETRILIETSKLEVPTWVIRLADHQNRPQGVAV